MWIINNNTDGSGNCLTKSVKIPDMDEPVSFEENPRQVSQEIGNVLVDGCQMIEEYTATEE